MTEEIKDETYFRLKEEYLSELQHLKEKCFAIEQESIQKSQMICELEQENKQMKSALKEIRKMVDCKRCKYINCNVSQCAKIETKVEEVLND